MTNGPAPQDRPPVLAVVTAVLGLAGAAVWAGMAVTVVATEDLTADGSSGVLWLVVLAALGGVQGLGAVRLLRRRGWRLLALGSVPGVLPVAVLVVLWTEYRQEMTSLDVLASLPVLPLVLLLLPPVRRWAVPGRPAPADREAAASGA